MTRLNIAIIAGSTRQGRFCDKPVQWVKELASRRDDFTVEVLDLREFPLPFFDEAGPPAAVPPKDEVAQKWAGALARFDGFIIVTPEYNHGVPGVLKNALDYAYKEWSLKPIAFVGYGGLGGARAVQSLRLTTSALRMAPLAKAVHIAAAEFMGLRGDKSFSDFPNLGQAAVAMFDELALWALALKVARQKIA